MNPGQKITLATIGSLGDLNPMLALGLELKKRGYAVQVATMEFYRKRVENARLDFSPLRPALTPDDPTLLRRVLDPVRGVEYLIRDLLLENLRDTFDDLMVATEKASALVTGETVFAGPLVAKMRNLKWATAILAPSSFISATDPPVIAALPFTRKIQGAPPFIHRMIYRISKASIRHWSLPIRNLNRELGLLMDGDPLFEGKFSPWLNLALFSETIGKPQPDWAPQTYQTGFVFLDDIDVGSQDVENLTSFLEEGDPPILFTLGSSAVQSPGSFFQESLEAAKRLNRKGVFLTGPNRISDSLESNLFQTSYVSYTDIMSRVSCVVHHGGVGTTAQALRAGIPQLVVPYAFDQADNAYRVKRIGVGQVMPKNEFTAKKVVPVIRDLIENPSYRNKAKEIRQFVESENGLSKACDLIEKTFES